MDRWKKDSRKDIVLGVEVTAGNVSDSVAWDTVYDQVTGKFPEVKFVTMDAGYKPPLDSQKREPAVSTSAALQRPQTVPETTGRRRDVSRGQRDDDEIM